MSSYKDLDVWKKSLELSVEIYQVTKTFPKEEIYGLISQVRRCSVSVPSNIAEGSKRGKNEFRHFVSIALGSTAELETQIMIAHKLDYLDTLKFNSILIEIDSITRMLSKLLKAL